MRRSTNRTVPRYVIGHTGLIVDTMGRGGRTLADLIEVCHRASAYVQLLASLKECVAWMKDEADAQDLPPCLVEAEAVIRETEKEGRS